MVFVDEFTRICLLNSLIRFWCEWAFTMSAVLQVSPAKGIRSGGFDRFE